MKYHLVTGATGFLGRYLVKSLLKQGDYVFVLIRPNQSSAQERAKEIFSDYFEKYKEKFNFLEGDFTKPDLNLDSNTLQVIKEKKAYIWHLGANLSFRAKDKEDIFNTNVEGTKKIVSLANQLGCRLYYTSTAFVCGRTTEKCKEDEFSSEKTLRNNYEQSKYLAEKYIKQECQTSFVIFRPAIIIGDAYQGKGRGCTFGYYRFFYMFYIFKKWVISQIQPEKKSTAGKILKFLGAIYDPQKDRVKIPFLIVLYPKKNTINFVSTNYVVNSMIYVANNPSIKNITFHLTNPNPPKFDFVFSVLLEDLGIDNIKKIGVSSSFFKLFIRSLYYIAIPLKSYFKSVFCYLPYISAEYDFALDNTKKFIPLPFSKITRDLMREINTNAKKMF